MVGQRTDTTKLYYLYSRVTPVVRLRIQVSYPVKGCFPECLYWLDSVPILQIPVLSAPLPSLRVLLFPSWLAPLPMYRGYGSPHNHPPPPAHGPPPSFIPGTTRPAPPRGGNGVLGDYAGGYGTPPPQGAPFDDFPPYDAPEAAGGHQHPPGQPPPRGTSTSNSRHRPSN